MRRLKKYILNLDDYQGASPRITGFKKLKKAGLPIPDPVLIINPDVFEEYKKIGL